MPDEFFSRHVGAQITDARPHVSMGELEPGPREGVGELVGVLKKAPRNLLVGRVHAHRQVGGEHRRREAFGGVVRVRDGAGTCAALGNPLLCACGALGQLPLEAEQILEILVGPLGWLAGPGDFQAAGDRVTALAGAEAVLPAKALMLDSCRLRLFRDVRRGRGAVGLAEGMPACDQRDGLFVVHGHAPERLANVDGGGDRVRLAVRTFRIDVDQTHLHGGERVFQVARVRHFAVVVGGNDAAAFDTGRTLRIADVAAEPLRLTPPVHILVRLPDVGSATGETKGFEAHAFQGHVARENHQVGPRQLVAVLLLDRPQQAAGLVQAHVVRPAVERCETLLAAASTATAIADAVSACAVPGHADEERPVVAEICWPPVLGSRHQRRQVLLDCSQIEALERLGVVELLPHRVRLRGVLMQQIEAQFFGPPVTIRPANSSGCVERALGFGRFVTHMNAPLMR